MNKIDKVVIVGGGVAGWLSALFLKTYLGDSLNLVVVAPSTIPPMSVGESTNGPYTKFLDALGVTRDLLIKECDATIKIASEFDGWVTSDNGYRWTHEFQPNTTHRGIPLFHYWMRLFREGKITSKYQDACFLNTNMIQQCRVPFGKIYDDSAFPYGYHLDGNKFIALLKRKAIEKGVYWIDDKLEHVSKNESDHIHYIVLQSGTKVEGDFFIDSTGFGRRLSTMAYSESDNTSFEDVYQYLRCDQAIHITLPHRSNDIRPSTLGTALSNGWVWDIPLSNRTSYGYVYSSLHAQRDSAELEFRKFINAPENAKAYHLSWIPGTQKKAWIKNCLSIGVSNSFIEPIESLTSATLTVELQNLLILFPNKHFHQGNIDRYNKIIKDQFCNNRDFISLHYQTSSRTDSKFWCDIRNSWKKSHRVIDLLENYLQQAPHTLEGIYDIKAIFGMFTSRGILPKNDFPLLDHVDNQGVYDLLQSIAIQNRSLNQTFYGHQEYLEKVREGIVT